METQSIITKSRYGINIRLMENEAELLRDVLESMSRGVVEMLFAKEPRKMPRVEDAYENIYKLYLQLDSELNDEDAEDREELVKLR